MSGLYNIKSWFEQSLDSLTHSDDDIDRRTGNQIAHTAPLVKIRQYAHILRHMQMGLLNVLGGNVEVQAYFSGPV